MTRGYLCAVVVLVVVLVVRGITGHAAEVDLEKQLADARNVYDEAVTKAADDLASAIQAKVDEAQRKGDLDLVQTYLSALRDVEQGGLPKEPRVGAIVKKSERDLQRAKQKLLTEYKNIEREYVRNGDVQRAKAIRAESTDLEAASVTLVANMPPKPGTEPKPAPPVKNGGATEAQQPERGTKVTYTNTVGIAFVHIPAVRFQLMGKATRLTRPYKIAITEVTQQQWEKVMGTTPWKGMPEVQEGPELPATFVSHDDAIAFCANLTALEKKAGQTHTYSLPTQTQWMYGCLAGQDAKWCCGNDENCLLNFAVYAGNAGDRGAHRVRTKAANVLGVFDMHGNVREWCLEGPFLGATGGFPGGDDPLGNVKHPRAVTRGGGWKSAAAECSVESATRSSRTEKSSDVGFRVVLF